MNRKFHTYHAYEISHYGDYRSRAELTLLDQNNGKVFSYMWIQNLEAFFFLNNQTFYPLNDKTKAYTQL